MTNAFEEAYARSIDDPEGFWGDAAEAITWTRKWDKVLDDSNVPFYRWFKGGELNTCYNCLDRHVEGGRAEQTALIYDSPVTGGTVKKYTYAELLDEDHVKGEWWRLTPHTKDVLAKAGFECDFDE